MNDKRQFFIPINGDKIAVTEEVYSAYYKLHRRERYLEERDRAKGKILYSEYDTAEILGEETVPDTESPGVEQAAIDAVMADKLHKCLTLLSHDERTLINALFFDGHSERAWAIQTATQRKTIAYRKRKVLAKLKHLLES
ncbi:MAG: sigma-70 family RNA polymerase sigma factor [Defluviitaleaceae bacterium]|nr:sigma-70 family RNA polymerase sigma factor [Defluviitaleaceae bacterium]MCL2275142.1 sigma-70 family RNA polymerase sigma factor [Defluviitaleaceae bacterium]